MKTLTKSQLESKFNKLNKQYMSLDKKLDSANENDSFFISQQMEAVQSEMSEVSIQLESL